METPTQTQTATIRKDLQQEELGVPVGEKYYHGSEPLPYRWINEEKDDEQFQVFFEGEWVEAYSIDFDY